MSTDPTQTQPDPAEFDLAAWIAGIVSERTVELHRPDPALSAEVARIEAQLDAMPDDTGDDGAERGITAAGPAALRARLDALRAKWERDTIHVVVREMDPVEAAAARAKAVEDGVDPEDRELLGFAVIAAAIKSMTTGDGKTLPPFTAADLRAMEQRGRAGALMVGELAKATIKGMEEPSSPFSRGSSTSPDGATSSAS